MTEHFRMQLIVDRECFDILGLEMNNSAFTREAIKFYSKNRNSITGPRKGATEGTNDNKLLKKLMVFFAENEDHIPLHEREQFIAALTAKEKVIISEL